MISTDPPDRLSTQHSNELAGWGHLYRRHARKKHISYHEYSHFLAEDSDSLVFRAAPLLRQAQLLLVLGVLLF